MALRSWRALTIALLLASACPPPRVSNALIVDVHGHDGPEAGKTLQSRGRNRIGQAVQVADGRAIAGLDGGRGRPGRPPRAFEARPGLPIAIQPPSPPDVPRTLLRLRC